MFDKAPEISPVPPSDAIKPSENEPTSKLRVLIVDDKPALSGLLETMLRNNRSSDIAEIQIAEDGQDALEKYEAGDPDLVFTDLNMPRMNGMELAHAIKKRRAEKEDTRPFNMILVSDGMGEVEVSKQQDLIDAGFSFLIKKPFRQANLLETFDKIKERRQIAKQPPTQP